VITITIDNALFEVYADRVLWDPAGEFTDAPAEYAKLARALVLCDYEARGEHTYVAGCKLLVSTQTGIRINAKSGFPRWLRAKTVMTGSLEGEKVISVLEFDDPLDRVITATEADQRFDLAETSAKQAAQKRWIHARKARGTWLISADAAKEKWG